jgi:hypothetical protein
MNVRIGFCLSFQIIFSVVRLIITFRKKISTACSRLSAIACYYNPQQPSPYLDFVSSASNRRFRRSCLLHVQGLSEDGGTRSIHPPDCVASQPGIWVLNLWLRAGKHYPHVTWAHVVLRAQLRCWRRFNIEFYDSDSLFCHSAYVTWSCGRLTRQHVSHISVVTHISWVVTNVSSAFCARNITWPHVTWG